MGTFGTWYETFSEIEAYLTQAESAVRTNKEGYLETHERVCVAHCFMGKRSFKGVLWSVFEDRIEGVRVDGFIRCDLLQCYRTQGGAEWYYKPGSEADHPLYYSCPLRYLEMVPEVTCQAWRDGVVEHYKRRRQKMRLRAEAKKRYAEEFAERQRKVLAAAGVR